jgi:hypothetical protein
MATVGGGHLQVQLCSDGCQHNESSEGLKRLDVAWDSTSSQVIAWMRLTESSPLNDGMLIAGCRLTL